MATGDFFGRTVSTGTGNNIVAGGGGGGGSMSITSPVTWTIGPASTTFTGGTMTWQPEAPTRPLRVECVGGHRVEGEMIRYVDGLYVSYCLDCNERMCFDTLPAHDLALRARQLGAELLDRIDLEGLAKFRELAGDLKAALIEIEAALEVVDIVELRADFNARS